MNSHYKNLPENFYWKTYLSLNNDLNQNASESEIIEHYLTYGIKENRKYKLQETEQVEIIEKQKQKIYSYPTYLENFNQLHEKELLLTRPFLKDNVRYLKNSIDPNVMYSFLSFILIIDFNNGGGGTSFFINTIVSKYKKNQTFLILRFDGNKYYININEEYLVNIKFYNTEDIILFIDIFKSKISKVFVNHFIDFDNKFVNYILNLKILKIGITHDYYNIFKKPQPTFKNIKELVDNYVNDSPIDINMYDILISQHESNIDIFSKYYKKRIKIVELPDFKYSLQRYEANNDTITCCVIGNINKIKGIEKLKELISYHKQYKTNIEFCVIGYIADIHDFNADIHDFNNYCPYNSIDELNNLLVKYKPNIIIELSMWPETYSYTLTLSMLTELPILYLNKPDNSVVLDRLKNYKKAHSFEEEDNLFELIKKNKQNYFYTISPIIYYNNFWSNLFINRREKIESKTISQIKQFKYGVKPYFIYFPQFHEICENNINYYKKFNDAKNLQLYNENEVLEYDIPLKKYCDLNDYDYILNKGLIQKQVDFINNYNFAGFAMYYYWFSVNTYTNKHMIMDSVIDKFFNKNINMYNKKIFFIWANEDWTNNIALAPGKNIKYKKIINTYDTKSFIENSENLIKYFKSNKYLKINNKPVFFIYHTYVIDNIDKFNDILNKKCIENGFDGVHLVTNSFDKVYSKYKNFYINFNYKKFESRIFDKYDNQIKLDYKTYLDTSYHFQKDKIQTVAFDFNNRTRLYLPDRLDKSTICINNSEFHKIVLTQKLLETYNNNSYTDIDKILLINAFNEWGENMTFEPSEELGYSNINLLLEILTS